MKVYISGSESPTGPARDVRDAIEAMGLTVVDRPSSAAVHIATHNATPRELILLGVSIGQGRTAIIYSGTGSWSGSWALTGVAVVDGIPALLGELNRHVVAAMHDRMNG